jgi:hypothetical protein
MLRGTGIRFPAGAICRFNGGSGSFNPGFDPYDAVGDTLVHDRNSAQWAGRWLNGRTEFGLNWSVLQTEWSMYIPTALAAAAQGKLSLPPGAYIEPGQWDGVATARERADVEYMGDLGWIRQYRDGLFPVVAGDGKTPETAMVVSLPRESSTLEWIMETTGAGTTYLHNVAPGASGKSAKWPAGRFPPGVQPAPPAPPAPPTPPVQPPPQPPAPPPAAPPTGLVLTARARQTVKLMPGWPPPNRPQQRARLEQLAKELESLLERKP